MAGNESCIVLLSGGMDSTTLLAEAVQRFQKVRTLTFNYNQRHKREIESAKTVSDFYKVPNKVVDITMINPLLQGSSLTSDEVDVPKGHYEEKSMQATVVPGRNTILLSIAAGHAASLGYSHVSFAAHAGDHAIYPDCRGEYVDAMNKVLSLFHYFPVKVWAPFLFGTKVQIIQAGLEMKVPYQLTWTCYEGKELACGKCGSCVERIEGFMLNQVVDPVQYEGGWETASQAAMSILRSGAKSSVL
jgi:7-cyano-7-deazaguanine synthase